ncbi:MAG: polysaccharide deacetylase family protein, partial [Smithella sp.]
MKSFRLDRFLTLYFFHFFNRRMQTSGELGVPILMYHSISDDREHGVHPYYKINTAPTIFADHMRFLSENNYSVIDLESLKNCFDKKHKLNTKYAVITFDDGYQDFYANAFPILQKYGFTATVFLPTSFISNEKLKLKGKDHLNWDEVKALSKAGISFGSHTVTHPQLSTLETEEVEYEIKLSKMVIEDKLGKEIDTFSYPFKFPEENKVFITLLRNILQKHGFRYGVSTRIGSVLKKDDIYFMKRIPINTGDDIPLFHAKL